MTQIEPQSSGAAVSAQAVNPAPPARTILFASVALLAGIGATAGLDRIGTETFLGALQAEATTITAGHDGFIGQCLAKQGDVLRRDCAIVVLLNAELEARLAAVQSEVAALEADVARTQAAAKIEAAMRLRSLDEEVFETRLRLAHSLREQFSQEIEHRAWRDFMDDRDKQPDLLSDGRVFQSVFNVDFSANEGARLQAVLNLQAAQNATEVLAAQVELCEKRLQDLEQLKSEIAETMRHPTGVAVAEARLTQAKEALRRSEQQSQALTLRTASFGKVGVFRKQAGDRVAAGEAVVELIDPDRQFVVAHIPSRSIPSFPPSTQVCLVFPGGERRIGRVADVPPQTERTQGFVPSSESSAAVVAVRIHPAGKVWPEVPIGSAVEVSLPR